MAASSFDNVADIYDATRALPEPVMASALAAMKRVLGDCATIIDVGVGTGRFASPLQGMGFGMVGVDISRGMLAKAYEKRAGELVLADASSLPFRDEAFDAAIIVHVLHLIKDWARVTREVGRVSRKKVVALVGRSDGPSMRAEYRRLRSELGYPLDRFEEGEEGLRRMVEPSEVIEVSRYDSEVSADDDIAYLEKRGSSSTWNLDETIHRRIIANLRASYGGKILLRKRLVEIAVWRPELLRP